MSFSSGYGIRAGRRGSESSSNPEAGLFYCALEGNWCPSSTLKGFFPSAFQLRGTLLCCPPFLREQRAGIGRKSWDRVL